MREIALRVKYQDKPLSVPLTKLNDANDIKLALDSFVILLQAMGDTPTKKSHYECVAFLLTTATKREPLRDELYS